MLPPLGTKCSRVSSHHKTPKMQQVMRRRPLHMNQYWTPQRGSPLRSWEASARSCRQCRAHAQAPLLLNQRIARSQVVWPPSHSHIRVHSLGPQLYLHRPPTLIS